MVERNERIERELNAPDNLYITWRRLDDGTYIALGRLAFTTALYIGVDTCSYERRYCFDDPTLAHAAFTDLKAGDDMPYGWIARRPETEEDREAKAQPGYTPSQFWPKQEKEHE